MAQQRVARYLLHRISIKRVPPRETISASAGATQSKYGHSEYDIESTRRFFSRFHGALELERRSVLDVGCGSGAVCVEAARRGATRVVGIDTRLSKKTSALVNGDPQLDGRVELLPTDGSLREIEGERFDVVLSKDSFEHYSDPESFVFELKNRVKPGGTLAIGFGPLWKGPTGGHIGFVTKMPWAHLLFPENVIMDERKRFRPEENAHAFEEIAGGLNKMTLGRFQTIMRSTDLECVYFETNVSDNPVVRGMKAVSRVPPLREFFTANVYSIWRKPAA